jgi:molybdopterin converting factor subunit 1
MRVRTLFFASYRELVGAAELDVALPPGSTVAGLIAELRSRGGGFASLPRDAAVAVNREYTTADTPLASGDEVALIPPVAGG